MLRWTPRPCPALPLRASQWSSTSPRTSGLWVSLLGITTLCFIFKEEFKDFYDWNKKIVRKDKISSCIAFLCSSNYSEKLVKVIGEMLDFNNYSRASADRVYSLLINEK